jgi:hypothetical protein
LGNQTYAAINFKAVNNIEIIPFLVGGMQQQQQTIDSLRNQLTQLQQQINNCCANSLGGGALHRVRNSIDVELGSERSIILQPAVPNPFAESTIIGYTVPVDVKEAKIIFFDNLGHVLQTVIINDRGEGQLNVYADNLSSGIYSYSLIADGKVIDTKKMVCSK